MATRVLPRDLGKQGKYAVGKGYNPKIGDDVDFYDRTGAKRYGIIVRISGSDIWIETREDNNEYLNKRGVVLTHKFEMIDDTL